MKGKILTLGIGTAIATTSLSSCNDSNDFLKENETINKKMKADRSTAISINNLSEEEKSYIHDMALLSCAILNNEKAAESFSESPSDFALSLGIKRPINTDDGTIRFLSAICKPEFKDAMTKRDIKRFVTLCEEQDIFKNAVSSNINLLKGSDILSRSNVSTEVAMGFFWIGEWIMLGVAYAGFAFEYNSIGGPIVCADNAINSEMALQLWDVETQDGSIYDLADEYKNQYTKDIVNLIKEKHPEVTEQYSDKELIELIQKSLKI